MEDTHRPIAPAPKPSSIVHAEDKFGASSPPALPEFTLEELIALGITVVETEDTKYVEIPFVAQKKMAEVVKSFGFGASKALDDMLRKILALLGFDGKVQCKVDEKTFAWTAWQSVKAEAPKDEPVPAETKKATSGDVVEQTIAERGKIYGDPELSHENIGYAWTGLIQQHYQCRFTRPFPAWLVELMMTSFKVHRSARVYHADNYIDLDAYSKFAREHQEKAFTLPPETAAT